MNSKNKVGILTYHTGYNYGASLQAYALSTVINKMGISCEIINFETARFLASREMFSRSPRRLKEFIKIITRVPYLTQLKKRQALFDCYTNKHLPISKLYREESDVIKNASIYDCIICGSDQIWNLSQNDAPAANLLFYLNFPKKQKRVSYAASFGKWVKEAPKYRDVIVPLLKNFDAVSVREHSGVEFLNSVGVDACITLDPTLLLDKEDYDLICQKRLIEHPYVLLFSWSCGNEVVTAAKKIANILKLPLINITPPPRALFSRITRKLDVGPCEFLSLIKYADFVVTDSFHGTAFSTNFEKSFVSIVSDNTPDPRMKSLLDQLQLSDHLVNTAEIDLEKISKTDFEIVRNKKTVLRKASLEFLENALAEFRKDK
ncbi:polysaccharide pyruvyl transferase family protein [Succinivibrio dextrinosolvens]|uniref:Polysaccharide pyruvyl transferase family protein WcaK n=1 Tax=Succinivibrio dextrinosolvens TaxID=83771 RepID=A0A662Z9T9_9GAMM|nr:polysaccharide pyruvyl transferase family protein [Succinivibrio dextrinosolvens]SFK14544.1 Polysaccharide pyruvyl transferase family protein WcaK [Succinivibrio dextrinosolvens]